MTHWTSIKGQLVDALGVQHDLLHVPAGLVIFGLLALVMWRRNGRLTWAIFGLLLLQVINEAFDAVQWVIWTGSIPWAEAVRDTAVTLAVPLAIVLVASMTRRVRTQSAAPETCEDPRSLPQGHSERPLHSPDCEIA